MGGMEQTDHGSHYIPETWEDLAEPSAVASRLPLSNAGRGLRAWRGVPDSSARVMAALASRPCRASNQDVLRELCDGIPVFVDGATGTISHDIPAADRGVYGGCSEHLVRRSLRAMRVLSPNSFCCRPDDACRHTGTAGRPYFQQARSMWRASSQATVPQ